MRTKIIAGNWKMNETPAETVGLLKLLKPMLEDSDADIVICPPFVDLPFAINELMGTKIAVGAQNMHYEDNGAYTGEISPAMLYELGVEYVIIGHSERRQYFAETNETVNKKVLKSFEYELYPIICCGETLEQREEGQTLSWIKEQITSAFKDVNPENAVNAIIAYEPIWAIGTGKVATTDQAEEVCGFIRTVVSELYDVEVSESIRVLYGGSVNGKNAAELFSMPDIDGGLVGGASLKEDFGTIAQYNK